MQLVTEVYVCMCVYVQGWGTARHGGGATAWNGVSTAGERRRNTAGM